MGRLDLLEKREESKVETFSVACGFVRKQSMNPFVEDERDHFPDLEDFHKVLAEKNEEGALIMDCIEMRSLQGCMDFNTIPGSPP
eukprot:g25713.t1